MSNVTVTISTAGANTLGARWCLAGVTEWIASGSSASVSNGSYTIQYRYVEGIVHLQRKILLSQEIPQQQAPMEPYPGRHPGSLLYQCATFVGRSLPVV